MTEISNRMQDKNALRSHFKVSVKAKPLSKYENIPSELKQLKQWVCFNLIETEKKPKKVPKNPFTGGNAKINEPETWGTFEEALQACEKYGFPLLAFALTKSDEYCGIDIDGCVINGFFNEFANKTLDHFPGTYAEFSTSGTGIHIICKGNIPEDGRKIPALNLELYNSNRFLIMTGDIFLDRKSILTLQPQLNSCWEKYFKREKAPCRLTSYTSLLLGDSDIIEKASKAQNGAKFTALMAGNLSHNNNDQSSADLALCSILTFYTQDVDQIDRIFRSSALMRKKWERENYRKRTINKAINGCSECYQPGSAHTQNKTQQGKQPRAFASNSHTNEDIDEGNSQNGGQANSNICKEKLSNKFQFHSAHSLMQEPSKINWIIQSYIDKGSFSVLFGEPGSMKSFLAIDIGLCVASGHSWHDSQIRNHGTVFYIAGEGFAGLSRRLKAWSLANSTSLTNVPFFISDRSAQILDGESINEVVQRIDDLQSKHGKPILVIIDTLNRNFGSGDENSTVDMTAFVSRIDAYIRFRYGCAVLIVHHSPLNDPSRARGASALRAALDWEYSLKRQGKDKIILAVTKVKDHEPPPAISFKPVSVQLEGWVDEEDRKELTSCVLKREMNDIVNVKLKLKLPSKTVLDCLIRLSKTDNSVEGVDLKDWREEAYKAGISKAKTEGAKRKAFQRAMKNLTSQGLVKGNGDLYWPTGGDK